MREIKFRAWDKENEHWYYFSFNEYPNYVDMFWEYANDSNYPVMQFTGLKDKNGKDIYEGDIFILNKDDDEWYMDVIYDEILTKYELRLFRNPVTDISLLYASKNDNCEIIGNIHENPELLK